MEITIGPHGLFDALSEPLGLVSAVTDVVEDVAGSVLHSLSALTGGLGSLLSVENGSGASHAEPNESTASGGILSFGPAGPAEPHEIETSKGYTDYGMSSLGYSDASSGGGHSLSMPPLDISVLDHDMDTGQLHSPSSSDEFGHRSAVDVLG
jgi:hypothetical protein